MAGQNETLFGERDSFNAARLNADKYKKVRKNDVGGRKLVRRNDVDSESLLKGQNGLGVSSHHQVNSQEVVNKR